MTRRPPRAAMRALPSAPSLRRQRPDSVLEGNAAEFALLAQRRARLRRQIDLLDHQREAAGRTMAQVEGRMAALSQIMGALVAAVPHAPSPAAPNVPAEAAAPRRRGALMQY